MTLEEASKLYHNHFVDVSKVIYIAYNAATGLTKIGITCDINRRIRQIETQSGCNIELLEYCFLGKFQTLSESEIEKILHNKYGKYRAIGEWFRLSEDEQGNAICDMIQLAEFGEFDC